MAAGYEDRVTSVRDRGRYVTRRATCGAGSWRPDRSRGPNPIERKILMSDIRVTIASGDLVSASRRGYILTAAVLLATMVGGTLPIPLYVLYEQQMGFG